MIRKRPQTTIHQTNAVYKATSTPGTDVQTVHDPRTTITMVLTVPQFVTQLDKERKKSNSKNKGEVNMMTERAPPVTF